VAIMVNRAVLAHRLFTGISRRHLACLIEELALPWEAGVEGRRHAAGGGTRKRLPGPVPGISWSLSTDWWPL
jgi:hypothetical protein